MLNEPIVVPSSYPHPHPRGRSATFPKRLKQPSNSLCTAHGRRSPGPLTGGRGGSTFGQMVEPTGIEPVTSCLQIGRTPWRMGALGVNGRTFGGLRAVAEPVSGRCVPQVLRPYLVPYRQLVRCIDGVGRLLCVGWQEEPIVARPVDGRRATGDGRRASGDGRRGISNGAVDDGLSVEHGAGED